MNELTGNDLKEIASRQDDLSISIYMPTEKLGSEVQENSIRWKNLVNRLEEQVLESGLSATDAQALLEPLRVLEVDREFWQHQSNTLAVLLTPGWMRRFRLPVESNEILEIGKRYVIKPFLPLIQQNGRYFILVLDLNHSRIYVATRFSIEELELDADTPTSLEESTRRDDAEPQMQWRTVGTRSPGRESDAIYHGHGGLSDEVKTQILRFFQKLNDGLQVFYGDGQTPMVLAGVDYLIPLFRQASRYSGLIDEAVSGSMKMMGPAELRDAAWQIVGPRFDQEREEALRLNRELSTTGEFSDRIEEILPAAMFGRVATLFIPIDVPQWGKFDPETGQVEPHAERQPGDEDLQNASAVYTIVNGGSVYAVDLGELPGTQPVAATFRYSAPEV